MNIFIFAAAMITYAIVTLMTGRHFYPRFRPLRAANLAVTA